MPVIDFTSNALQIGNLTITTANGFPAIVGGVGLGESSVGPVGSISRLMYFPAGSLNPTAQTNAGKMTIISATKLSSIVLQPFFQIVSPSDPTKLQFEFWYKLSGIVNNQPDGYTPIDPHAPAPFSIPLIAGDLPNQIDISINSNMDMQRHFATYLAARPNESHTFIFGVSITTIATT